MEIVVTGTGTEIGKTVVSAVLLARWMGRMGVAYWKPVATGAEEGSDSREVASLVGPELRVLEECYRFAPPLSPHLAARLAGVEIEPERIVSAYRRHRESAGNRLLVVEGIGGILVPLTDRGYLLADLLSATGPALPRGLVEPARDHQPHSPDPRSAPFQRPESGGSGPERSPQPGESTGHREVRSHPCRGGVGTPQSPLPGNRYPGGFRIRPGRGAGTLSPEVPAGRRDAVG